MRVCRISCSNTVASPLREPDHLYAVTGKVYFPYTRELRMKSSKLNPVMSALALAAALMGAGCDSSDSGSPGPSGSAHGSLIDACTLLTDAEAVVILGEPVVKVKTDTLAHITFCSYIGTVKTGKFLPNEVEVSAFTTAGVQPVSHITVPQYMANLKSVTPDSNKIQLTGIGADAIWLKRPCKLSMYKADVYADITYRPFGTLVDTSAAAFEGAKAAGLKVAEKL